MVDFNKLRFDRTHHLGLGDVRLTIGQQQEIEAEIAALRARVEALEAGIERVAASADMICDDEACSPSLVRKTLCAVRDSARALLERKP